MRAKGSRAGVTLVEVLIVATLLSVVFGAVLTTGDSMSRAFRTGDAISNLETRARRSVDRVCERLLLANRSTAAPQLAAPLHASWIELQRSTGFDGGATTWGNTERVAYQPSPLDPDDGVDNDGDGVVDEGHLVWVRDVGLPGERTSVICTDVREYLEGETFDGLDENGNGLGDENGFCITFDGERATVRLTLERMGPNGLLVTRTFERTIVLRMGDV